MNASEILRTLDVDGRTRSYLLHVPHVSEPPRSWPVVLAFHGATSNGRLMRQFSGLDAKADAAGFLAVYPNGTGNLPNVLTWNGGGCCGYAAKNGVDDVAYVRALLDDLETVRPIDRRRVFAAGMSNGAHLVYRLACAMPDRIAAIAGVAGPMGIDACRPPRGMPVLHIHGTEDEFAPFHGGKGPRSVYGVEMISVEDTMRRWVEANDCPPVPRIEEIPDHVGDGTRVIRKTYGPGRDGAEVVLVVVEGAGHTWPGRPPLPASLGKSSNNIAANDLIWDFFERHPMPVTSDRSPP